MNFDEFLKGIFDFIEVTRITIHDFSVSFCVFCDMK